MTSAAILAQDGFGSQHLLYVFGMTFLLLVNVLWLLWDAHCSAIAVVLASGLCGLLLASHGLACIQHEVGSEVAWLDISVATILVSLPCAQFISSCCGTHLQLTGVVSSVARIP